MLGRWVSPNVVRRLRVADGFLKGGRARDAKRASRHIETLRFRAAHYLAETLAFLADAVFGRHREIGEVQFAGLHTLVAQLVDITA